MIAAGLSTQHEVPNAHCENYSRRLSAARGMPASRALDCRHSRRCDSRAVKCFMAPWLIVTLINLWFGVSRAGYTVRDETPVALIVFAVPASAAIAIWWKG